MTRIDPELTLDYVAVTNQQKDIEADQIQPDDANDALISQGASQYSIMDLIRYHLLNNTYDLPNDFPDNVTVVNTILTNQTVDILGNGVPLLINKYGNDSLNYTIGNGMGEANVTTDAIRASNGVIYVINKGLFLSKFTCIFFLLIMPLIVLVPPEQPSQVATHIPELAGINFFLQTSDSFAEQIDNATNVRMLFWFRCRHFFVLIGDYSRSHILPRSMMHSKLWISKIWIIRRCKL